MKKRIQTPAARLDEFMSEEARPKFCVDCTHFNPVAGRFFCAAARSLVTGVPQETDCWEMRSEVRGGECGREGRMFKLADSVAA